jgi:hypothetical protein
MLAVMSRHYIRVDEYPHVHGITHHNSTFWSAERTLAALVASEAL